MKIRSRSSSTWVYVVVGALVLLIASVVAIIWVIYLWVTDETTDYALTPEGRKNPWLAISELGERYGVTVNTGSILSSDNMPAPTDTILLEDAQSSVVSERDSDALETWVLQGGTLIYRVPMIGLADQRHTLETTYFPNNLMVFEVGLHSVVERLFEQSQEVWKRSCFPPTSSIWFEDGDVATLEWRPTFSLNTSFSPYAADLVHLSQHNTLQLNYGHGQVFFVTDIDYWKNHSVNCADNAYVFLRLVRDSVNLLPGMANEVSVWIVPRVPLRTTRFLEMVWSHFHVAIIGLLLTFLVALIAGNIRSTPAVHAIPVPRRATIDYVTSVSNFAWRKNSIEGFFRSLDWVSENPTGVFGPTQALISRQKKTELTKTDETAHVNSSPRTEVDLVTNVQKLQAKLRRNMQPSIRKS